MDPFQQGQPQVQSVAQPQPSQSKLGCVLWSIGAVLVLGGVSVGAWYFLMELRHAGVQTTEVWGGGAPGIATGGGSWNGSGPFTCGGIDNVTIEGVTASLPGATAIEAGGNCRLTLVNVNITAGVPISAGGNANVTVTGGSLAGTQSSIAAGGNSRVTVSGATVSGPVSRSGFARIIGVP